jgi:hypothetical protein
MNLAAKLAEWFHSSASIVELLGGPPSLVASLPVLNS